MTPSTLAAAIGCSIAKAELYAPYFDETCAAFEITTPARLAAFIAQVGHESGGLQYTEELASGAAYEGRVDLGNTEPGWGKLYKGHGIIQTTGHTNHVAARDGLRRLGFNCPDFESVPEALTEPRWACLSAGYFWHEHGCNELADVGDFERITRVINGGLNGQADRLKRWEKAKAVLMTPQATQAPSNQTNAPQADPVTPKGGLMPVIAFALNALLAAIPALQAKWGSDGGAVATRNVALATTVVQTALAATNSVNEQQLVEKLKSSPEAVKQATEAVQGIWWMIDGSGIPAAREADAKFAAAGAPVWRSPSFLFTLMMWPIMAAIVGALIGLWGTLKLSESLTGNLLTGIITAILFGGAGYYYGAMTSSNKPSPST